MLCILDKKASEGESLLSLDAMPNKSHFSHNISVNFSIYIQNEILEM